MPKSDLVFGTFSTSTSGGKYYKTQPINFPTPEKDVEVYEVPGRSGDLIVDYGSYKNVEITAEIAIQATAPDTFLTLYDALRASIMVQSGYQRLEDSLYTNEYRLARSTGVEMQQADSMRGTATITFNAKPQRYLTSGEEVALTLTTTPGGLFSRCFVGQGGIIFNSATLNALRAAGVVNPESLTYLVVDITDYIGGEAYVRLFYQPSAGITLADGTQNQILLGRDAGSPFAGEVSADAHVDTATLETTAVFPMPHGTEYNWMYVIMPDSAQVISPGDEPFIYADLTPISDTLTPPNSALTYSPLVRIGVSGASNGPAVFLNDDYIVLNTPASVSGVTLTDVYVDLETFNAYALDSGLTYNLNKYVELYGSFQFVGDIEVRAGVSINNVDIIPRWWKL